MIKQNNINNLSEAAIQCRAWRHYWKPSTAEQMTINRQRGYYVTLVCGRNCGTKKVFFLSMKGEYGEATTIYGDNYLLDHAATPEEREQIKALALIDLITPKEDTGTVVQFSSKKGSK